MSFAGRCMAYMILWRLYIYIGFEYVCFWVRCLFYIGSAVGLGSRPFLSRVVEDRVRAVC